MRLAGRGHGVLLHGLQQRGLRLRRRAVDLVGQHHVREDRPAHEGEAAPTRGVILLQQLGAGDVARHQVGRELHAREAELERFRHGVHEQRLRQPGHADQQRVPAGEHGGEQVVHDGVLADDTAADLRHQGASRLQQLIEQFEVACVVVVAHRYGRLAGHRQDRDRGRRKLMPRRRGCAGGARRVASRAAAQAGAPRQGPEHGGGVRAAHNAVSLGAPGTAQRAAARSRIVADPGRIIPGAGRRVPACRAPPNAPPTRA